MRNYKSALGKHIILDYYDCEFDGLSDPDKVRDLVEHVSKIMGATVVTSNFHHFSPLGVSGIMVIAESHITIHTWPEHKYVAVDIFYCGFLEIENGLEKLKSLLQSNRIKIMELDRGENILDP